MQLQEPPERTKPIDFNINPFCSYMSVLAVSKTSPPPQWQNTACQNSRPFDHGSGLGRPCSAGGYKELSLASQNGFEAQALGFETRYNPRARAMCPLFWVDGPPAQVLTFFAVHPLGTGQPPATSANQFGAHLILNLLFLGRAYKGFFLRAAGCRIRAGDPKNKYPFLRLFTSKSSLKSIFIPYFDREGALARR